MKNTLLFILVLSFVQIQDGKSQCPQPLNAPEFIWVSGSNGHTCKLFTETGFELIQENCGGRTYKGVGPAGSNINWKFDIRLNIQGTYFFKYKIKIFRAPFSSDITKWSSYSKVAESTMRRFDKPSVDQFQDNWDTNLNHGYTYRAKITYKIRRKNRFWPTFWSNISSNTWNAYSCLPNADFNINSQSTSEIVANLDEDFLMNLEEAISCDQKYFLSIQQSDQFWNGFGEENISTLQESELNQYGGKNAFDLKRFNDSFGTFRFQPGQSYRIKLAVGPPWTDKLALLKIAPCDPVVEYTLNDQSGSQVTTFENDPLILDLTNTFSCTGDYYISISPSDSNGSPIGPKNEEWLSQDAINQYGGLETFNLRDYNSSFESFDFEPEKFYRIKVGLGNGTSWTEKAVLLYIQKLCIPYVSFTINNKSGSEISVYNDVPTILNFSNTIPCTGYYFISIQESDAYWTRFGPENMLWLSEEEVLEYGGKTSFNLKAYNNSFGTFNFQKNKHYRIKVAVNAPWTDRTILMRIRDSVIDQGLQGRK